MASAELGGVVTFYTEGASATALAVASERNFSLSYDLDEIDTSAKGDTVRTSTPGKVKITASVEGMYVHTDAAQARLITLMESGSQIEIKIYRSGSAYKTGTGQLTNLTITHSDNEAATFSASIALDGALTAS